MTHDFFTGSSDRIPSDSNGQLVLKGLHHTADGFAAGELTYNIQGDLAGLGDPITADAAAEMLRRWQEAFPKVQETYVEFGKETLLFLLSQAGCEGIRFYFCKNHNNANSLVLIGVDKDGKEINCEHIGDYTRRQPYIVEVGGGGSIQDITAEIEDSDNPRCLLYRYFKQSKING